MPKEFVCATDAVLKPRGSVCLGPNNYVNPDDWWAVKEALIIGSFTKMEGSRADEFRYGYDPVRNRMAMEDKGAWKGSLVEVAIGDLSSGATRQITGVAAGRFDTDLINVAQLKEFQRWRWEDSMWTASVPANFSVNHVTTSLGVGIGRALHLVGEEGFNVSANSLQTEEGAEVYVNVKLDHIVKKGGQIGIRDTEITLANSVFNIGDKGIKNIKSVALSEDSTEAVTGAQLYGVKQNAKSLNEQIRSVGIKLTKLNTNISEYLGGGADVLEGKAPIYTIQGDELQGVHAAFDGVDSKLAELDGKVVFVQKRLAARLEDESLVVQDEETYDITIGKDVEGGEISIVNDKGKFRVLTGLEDGDVSRKSTEAVTGAQLYGVKQNAKSLNEQIRSVGIKLTKLNTNISEYLGGGADVLEGKAPIYIIQGEEHQGVHAAFLGVDSKLAELDGKVVFVQKRLAARLEDESLVVQDEETYDITIGKDVEGGEISIVNDEDEFRVLTGLKDGDVSKKSTEAVTGAQLYEVNQEIEPLRSDVDGFQRNVTKLNGNINKYLGGGANVLLGKAPIYIIQGEEHQGVHAAFLGVDSKLAELDGKVVFVQKRLAARLEDESLVVQDEETYDITIGKDVEGGEISIVNDEDEFRILTGLEDGDVSRKSTEAVTGAQLYGVKQNAEILKDQIRRLSTDVTVLYRSVNGYLGGGVNVLEEGKAPIYIIQGEEHQGVHAAFLGVDSKLTELDNKISNPGNVGDSRDVGDSSLVQQNEGSKLITIGGQVVGNEIKVTNKEGENRILTGLEDGDVSRKSTEAVTGAQLYGVKQNAKSLNEQIRSVGIKLTKLNTNISEYLGGGADVLEGKAPIYIIQGEEHQGVHAAFLGVDSKLTELDNKISNPGNVGDSRDVGDSSLVQQNEGSKLITIGGQVVGNEIKVTNKEGENRILSGLAAGKLSEDSTEAVTGAQLYGVKQNAEILEGRIDGVDGDVKKLDENINNYLGGGVDVEYLGGGVDVLEGKAPIYIIQGEEHQGVHTAFLGVDSKLTELDNKINDIVAGNGFIGQNSNTGLIVVGDKTKGIEINIANKDKETRILTGVADGDVSKDSTEAITGNQLYELNNQLAAYLGGGAGYQDGQWIDPTFTITDFGGQSKNGKQAYNNVADAFEAVNSSMSGLSNRIDHVEHQVGSQVNSDGLNWNAGKNAYDASHNGQVGKITNVKDGVIAAGSTDAITGNQLWAAYEKVNHLEDRFDAFTGGIVTYDKDEQGKKTNTITLVGGKEDEPVVIDNVAGGKIEEGSKQAVNGGQLHNYVQEQMSLVLADANKYTDEKIENIKNKENILTDIITQTNAYTDMKFNALSSEIEKAQKEARQAAAISLAVSNLRYSNTAGKFSIAFGSGVWRGQSALAFGTGYMSEDGKVRSNFSVTTSGGHWGVGAGLSLALK
ncbi:YadA-like family protein [Helicobacter pylori]